MNSETPHRVVPPSRRRDKPILSCNLCRRRKLKCDRQHPCKTCVDRGLSLSCAYTRNVPPAHEPKPTNVHDRIDQLERLVTSLMGTKSGENIAAALGNHEASPISGFTSPVSYEEPSPAEDSGDPEIVATPETVKLEKDGTTYHSSGHWSNILDGIAELREELERIPTTPQPQNPNLSEMPGPDLLFGRQRHATHSELLAAVPPKPESDNLMRIYWASMEMAPNLVHRATFEREYTRFWESPEETPIMWLAVLFSLYCLAVRFQWIFDANGPHFHDLVDAPVRNVRMDFYREKSVQCLILGNYGKCPPYTIEALLQYFVTEYFRSQDSQFGTWMLVGMLVRIAFRMGYHRDPSKFSNISVFRGELRRRVWTMIVQVDLLSSSQMGLPRMIQKNMYDTAEPRNLKDEDLDENMKVLPPSRPETELTPLLYALMRNRLLHVFARIIDLTNMSPPPPYKEIMEVDVELHATYEKLPPTMKPFRAREITSTDPDTAKRRLHLAVNFLKASVMLHRPYHLLGRTDPRYERSRMLCLDSALEMLELQRLLERESDLPAGIWSERWHIWSITWRMSSMVNHDFLLATTVLSLDLDRDVASPMPVPLPTSTPRQRFKEGQPSRAEIIEALKDAYSFWNKVSYNSREARKIAAAVKLVLGKAGAHVEQDPNIVDHGTPHPFDFNNFASSNQPKYHRAQAQNTDPSLFGLDNPHLSPPLFNGDGTLDIPGFEWRGMEMDFSTFDNNHFQDAYFG